MAAEGSELRVFIEDKINEECKQITDFCINVQHPLFRGSFGMFSDVWTVDRWLRFVTEKKTSHIVNIEVVSKRAANPIVFWASNETEASLQKDDDLVVRFGSGLGRNSQI